ncbi:gliding motility-associated lipoprotein GldD [Dysgonomonadaceae bacterium PH5-43]|nr:gliding motility-associated lipoprotein GldD [Dysgonomonadaceae bacterium PH5-43]
MKLFNYIFILFLALVFIACDKYVPKPSGYFRIDLPEQNYVRLTQFDEFDCLVSDNANIRQASDYDINNKEGKYFNIYYPSLNAEIFCSYIPLKNKNVIDLLEESRKFVYLHTIKADAISENIFVDDSERVCSTVYNIKGDVASPTQFIITDSIKSFFRGALYFVNDVPIQDSIAPVLEYVNEDIKVLIESFRWK